MLLLFSLLTTDDSLEVSNVSQNQALIIYLTQEEFNLLLSTRHKESSITLAFPLEWMGLYQDSVYLGHVKKEFQELSGKDSSQST